MNQHWEAVSPYLEQALALSDEDRTRWLAKLKEEHSDLADLLHTFLDEYRVLAQEKFLENDRAPLLASAPLPGMSIGAYRLVSLIGEGGMGSVWLAERSDGEIRQNTAIKLLRADADRPSSREHFLQERQLLANLSHPAIARLLDAGHTSGGRPYLVMEQIEGVPIDVYAERLPVSERLSLFLRVCEGVSHAHGRLIIHRDLKPSNILVDGAGQPKILDFGIAKLLDPEAVSMQTIERILTPGYASPEQFRGMAQTIATDIYSLGAVLYKLLTGRSPHTKADGLTVPKPVVPASRVNPQLPRDLDCILQKALRAEPDERYASVDAFAADVRAFLEFRPVAARSGNRWYRARQFLRRHGAPTAAAAVTVAGLALGLLVANRERAIAERRFLDVRQLANKLFDIDALASQVPGNTQTRQLIVDTSLEYLRRLSGDAQGDPGLALELANAYLQVARIQGVGVGRNLGETAQADNSLRAAEGLIQSVLSVQPTNRTALLRGAVIAHDRMVLAGSQSGRRTNARHPETLALARQALGLLEEFHPSAGDSAKDLNEAFDVYMNVGDQLVQAHQFDDAIALCRRAGSLAGSTGHRDALAMLLWVTGRALEERGELEGARSAMQESVKLQDPLPVNASVSDTMRLAHVLIWEGRILDQENGLDLDRSEEARAVLNRAFAMIDEVVHQDPKDQSARARLGMAGIAMAGTLRRTNPIHALAVYDHILRHTAELRGGNSSIRRLEVEALAGSTYPLRRLRRSAEARKRLDAAFERLSALNLYPAAKVTLGSSPYKAIRALADFEGGNGNLPRAIELYDGLLQQTAAAGSEPRDLLEDAVDHSNILQAIAALQRRSGRADLAEAASARRLELWRHWARKLPGNAFVARRLAEAR